MSLWIVFALIAPAFWALSNIVDKIAVDKVLEGANQFMFLLSQFYTVVFLIYMVLFFEPDRVSAVAIFAGSCLFLLYYLYSVTLADEDISAIIVVHQATPLFVLAMFTTLYKVLPTVREGVGFLLISVGILWFSWPRRQRAIPHKPLISLRSTFLLLLSALVAAVSTMASDLALNDLTLVELVGQTAFGYGAAGLVALLMRRYRRQSVFAGNAGMLRKSMLVGLTGVLDLSGYVCFYIALDTSTNAGLVSAVTSIHPIFVVAMSGIGALVFPQVISEDNSGGRLLRKGIGCIIVVGGVMLLN